jgi:calcium-dependent protein kinase
MHRDLKPENFLLHSHSSNMLKLIDFGASCPYSPGEFLTHQIGTSYYMAPEMISNKYSEKCDLWSIGVILHIMLIGSPPFEGKNDSEILKKIQKTKLDPTHQKYKKINPKAKDLLFKLLNTNPSLRPSAREALNHEWLKKTLLKPVDRASSMSLLENLQSFHPHKNIEKLTLSFITSHLLTSSEIEKMTELFESWDIDQSGTLSREEFKAGIGGFISLSDREIADLFMDIDTDSSGEIDFSEFVTACCVRDGLMNRKILGIVFNEYDYDRTGRVDREKLKHLVAGHKSFDDCVWDQIIGEIDDKGRGSFDFEQFYQALASK